jgi:[ribosomal protein S5]-alanine N-acetyltransferase
MPMPAQFFPMIETRRLWIRPMRITDAAALMTVNGDDEVMRFLPHPTWRTIADGVAWIEGMFALQDRGDTYSFVISRRSDGRIIGSCFLFNVAMDNARAEIGYGLSRPNWGRGYATEAMTAFISRAFAVLGLRRLEAEIDPRNTGSAKVVEGLGFLLEGLLRERWNLKEGIADARLYGLLRSDWTARCRAQGKAHAQIDARAHTCQSAPSNSAFRRFPSRGTDVETAAQATLPAPCPPVRSSA